MSSDISRRIPWSIDILGGYNFLLHDTTTVMYASSLTTSAAISAQSNFQGLILGGYIYRYTPVATSLSIPPNVATILVRKSRYIQLLLLGLFFSTVAGFGACTIFMATLHSRCGH